jgi:hypothetical protein
MRPVLTTDEIKKVFKLAFNEINNNEDDIITWEQTYKIFSDIQKNSFEKFISKKYFDEEKLKTIIKGMNLKDEEQERIFIFLIVVTLICEASAIKKLVQNIVDNYEEN